MQYEGNPNTKKVFVNKIKFQFNWASCTSSGNLDTNEKEYKLTSHMTLVHSPAPPLTLCKLFTFSENHLKPERIVAVPKLNNSKTPMHQHNHLSACPHVLNHSEDGLDLEDIFLHRLLILLPIAPP